MCRFLRIATALRAKYPNASVSRPSARRCCMMERKVSFSFLHLRSTTAAGGYAAVSAGKSVQTALQEAPPALAVCAAGHPRCRQQTKGIFAQARINHRKRGKLNLRKGGRTLQSNEAAVFPAACVKEPVLPCSAWRRTALPKSIISRRPQRSRRARRGRPVRLSFSSAENVKADRRVCLFASTARI